MRRTKWLAVAVLWAAGADVALAQVDLAPYLRRDAYETIKISPDGLHFAATVPLEDRTGIVVLRRSDKRVLAKAIGVEHSAVADFWWADNKRIVVAMAQALGSKDPLYLTGELHALGIDDAKVKTLFGPPRPAAGLVEVYGGNERDMATFIAPLPEDPGSVLIAVWPLNYNPRTRVEKLNAYTGHRTPVASAPVRRANFTVDAKGEVRFADGADDRNYQRLYYRAGADADWQLVNDEQASGRVMSALGLSADGTVAYLRVDQAEGPDVIESWDTRTQARKLLLRDPLVNPYAVIHDKDGRTPIGMQYMDAGVHSRFFDEDSPMARLHHELERAFPRSAVSVTSFTADGGLALLRVWNDRMLGDYYLYDTRTRAAVGVFARREWLDPEQLPGSRQVALKARDGVALHAYLTVPKGREAKALPLVVMPHGGPYGVFDEWAFDDDTQLLAAAGYAVLRVNYRGSGNYGKAFRELGARQWGGTMQDDLTDATRWAIDQGIANSDRICIYGASYGGYAALMGAAKEPGLYRCAVGYVGVYDLVAMHREDSRHASWLKHWANDWIGERDGLAARSPVELAGRIKAPVFLAAGGADPRAPIAHSKKMERALRDAKVPVETLYFPSEGHGFTTEPHRRAFYTQLLDFLGRHIGEKREK
jgi:dipeptidyl aminopeptidase/acylaminoacyl peptidase